MKIYLKLYGKRKRINNTLKYEPSIYVAIDSDKIAFITGEPECFVEMAKIYLLEPCEDFPQYYKHVDGIENIRFTPKKGIKYLTEIPKEYISR